MECPICSQGARVVRAPAFDGRRIICARCGTYDVSREVYMGQLLERIDEAKRRDVLDRARRNAADRSRPIITTYLL